VRITKIDLPQQVQDSVFDRMRASFKAQAAKLRAEGVESSERTRADANKQQFAGRAMPLPAKSTHGRIRRTRNSTASTAACSRTEKPWEPRATCW
jgi:hypothetical protein